MVILAFSLDYWLNDLSCFLSALILPFQMLHCIFGLGLQIAGPTEPLGCAFLALLFSKTKILTVALRFLEKPVP